MIKKLDARLAVIRNNFELCSVPYNIKIICRNMSNIRLRYSLANARRFLYSTKLTTRITIVSSMYIVATVNIWPAADIVRTDFMLEYLIEMFLNEIKLKTLHKQKQFVIG